jgi:hypothetical protein
MDREDIRNAEGIDRRDFLKLGTATGLGFLTGNVVPNAEATAPQSSAASTQPVMPTRNLGRTGHRVGVFSLGGQSAIEKPNNADAAVPIVERALDLGINLGRRDLCRRRRHGSAPPPAGETGTEPNREPGKITMREALDYVLSLPVSTVIIGCDSVAQLEENVELARTFNPITEAQRLALTEQTKPIAEDALFFRRWG